MSYDGVAPANNVSSVDARLTVGHNVSASIFRSYLSLVTPRAPPILNVVWIGSKFGGCISSELIKKCWREIIREIEDEVLRRIGLN